MWLKIALLLIVFLALISPAVFSDRLKAGDSRASRQSKVHVLPRYNGPKTDDRINRMFTECRELLTGLSVPISESVSPVVKLNGRRSAFGLCIPKGSGKSRSDYDFYIEMSGFSVNNSEKSIRNTLLHELIHTVPGGMCHTGEWKKWAQYVSEKTGFHISRCGSEDETPRDLQNLING